MRKKSTKLRISEVYILIFRAVHSIKKLYELLKNIYENVIIIIFFISNCNFIWLRNLSDHPETTSILVWLVPNTFGICIVVSGRLSLNRNAWRAHSAYIVRYKNTDPTKFKNNNAKQIKLVQFYRTQHINSIPSANPLL